MEKKTHKLTIKGKIFTIFTELEAKKMFDRLIQNEPVKIKILDTEKLIYIYPYVTDIQLLKLDDLEFIIENTYIPRHQKNEVYNILSKRKEEEKRINDQIIQNIIDEIMKLDN
jgi:mevalonate kinase